jgi:hypothetical protein
VEQSKLPEFFKQKVKDTISALDFMRHIDDLARTNKWSYNVTYNNLSNALRGVARKWLFSVVNMVNYSTDQLLCSNLKPCFLKEFAVQLNDELIMEGLSNLAMKPTEDTRDLLNWITDTMVNIKESYNSY